MTALALPANFNGPNGVIIDPTNTYLYVADNFAIRRIVISTKVVTTIAGNGLTAGYADGIGILATVNVPGGMILDVANANLYISDTFNAIIRKLNLATGVMTTLAGGYPSTSGTTITAQTGYVDGTGRNTRFNRPYNFVNDGSDNVYLADRFNNVIRKIALSTGVVTTFAGNTSGTAGSANGTGTAAYFNNPKGITSDGAGNLYITDNGNNLMRKITPAGIVTTLAGSGTNSTVDGTGTGASYAGGFGVSTVVTGSFQGFIYSVDQNTNTIRKTSINGYSISPTLPAGLSFDATTGTISGTPTVSISATVYTVTAYNYYGQYSTPITFIINCAAGPTVTINTQPTCTTQTGSITAVASGALGYSLDGGTVQTSGVFTGISGGTHSVASTYSGNTCVNSTSFSLNYPTYTWTGATSTDPTDGSNWATGVAPPLTNTGTTVASLTIPHVFIGNYPKLTANASIFNLSITGSDATFDLNGFTLNVGCNIVNLTTGGVLTYTSNLNSTLNWNGTTNQSYTGNTTAATAAIGNLTVNNTGATGANTVTLSGGPVDIYNTVNMTKGNLTISASPALLTLKSSATQTATVTQITTVASVTPTINGNVNTERFITGGTGYRGYRLLSSPVNISSNVAGGGNISLQYINTTPTGSTNYGALTGGPGGSTNGFTVANANPTIYLYNEGKTSSNGAYVSGKNVGVVAVGATTVSTLSGSTTSTGVSIPVGNGYLSYFIGNNQSTVVANTRVPENTTITATGYLNQGTIPVNIWGTTASSATLSYTAATGAAIAGINQVGNPYASAISLDVVYTDNYNAMTNAISPTFYELNEPGQSYISYNASTGSTSNTRAGKYVMSGQGFLAVATLAGQKLTFKEDQKVTMQLITSPATTTPPTPALLLALRIATNTIGGLHLQLVKDSLDNTETGIYFNSKWADTFDPSEDAIDLYGTSQKVFLSSYTTDGARVAINQLSNITKGKRLPLFVNAKSTGQYNLGLADINNIDTVYNVYLVDKLLKDSVDLRTRKTYGFTINTADTTTFGANRFELSITLRPVPPYGLLSFGGQKVGNGVQLLWKTVNAGNYTGFGIEKLSGNQYVALSSLQSDGSTAYNYIDNRPSSGINTYRLAQNDILGNTTYSLPVDIDYSYLTTDGPLSVYPNPTRGAINIYVNLPSNTYNFNIYNSIGGLMRHQTVNGTSWAEDVTAYNAGTYIIEMTDSKGSFVGKTKFVKLK